MLKVAICQDFREEGWPSMDRVAEALVAELARTHGSEIEATLVAPPFRRRASRLASGRAAANFDRGVNRLWDYPRHLRRLASRYDIFHIIDHSYAQLVHALPAERTVVTCHDLDTFRSLLDPEGEPRSMAFKAMTRQILNGLRAAACVTCDTAAIATELSARGLIEREKIIVAPIGVERVFTNHADAESDAEAARLVGAPAGATEVLHVGSTVARKRIDTLLRVLAAARAVRPDAHLVRAGGPFTREQEQLARELGLDAHVSVLPPISDRLLAAVYRRASVLLLPSEREGFGLPVVEAMACGTPVIASDIPVLREVGGGAVEYCERRDVAAWTRTLIALIDECQSGRARWDERVARGLISASRYSWDSFAALSVRAYAHVNQPVCLA